MAEEKKTRRNLTAYKINPFLDDQLITQLSNKKNIYFTQTTSNSILDLKTGEVDPAKLQVVKQIRADKEQFVKLYTSHLKTFFELSTNAFKVLQYILYTIQESAINKDKVFLSLAFAVEFFESNNSNISKSSYYNAIKELLEKRFIAETIQQNLYFINIKLFFNGDRIEFITQFNCDNSLSKDEVLKQTQNKEIESK